ncbi:hypothetical protein HKD37_15G042610 [Glycine soja]
MLKVCIEEVNAENKPHNHFIKLGWANIAEKFNKATSLGWDEEKKTIAASDEWWEAKIQTNDNIDDNTDMEVNEPEIDTITRNTSSEKESGQRKRGREGDKRIGVAAKLSSQLDRIIQTFESSVSAQDPTSITACVEKLKDLLGLEHGSELFYKAIRLMKKRANKITFVALEEPKLQLGWINTIERAFGLCKTRRKILGNMPHFALKIQNQIIVACMTIHNFIQRNDKSDGEFDSLDEDNEYIDSDEDENDVGPSTTTWEEHDAQSTLQMERFREFLENMFQHKDV